MAEIKIGDWYYRMMGYGGSESQYCCIIGKTGEKTMPNTFSLFGGVGDTMKALPVTEIFIALDEKGVEHRVSANDLAENGHIGIGTLEVPKYGHSASIYREDAELLVETGMYTKGEIEAEFPFAFKSYDETEEGIEARPFVPMTEKQIEIYKAAHKANDEKAKRELEERNRKFRAAVEECKKKYSYIPCPKSEGVYLRTGEVSRNLRAVLAHEFPNVKFSVKSNSFSGGDSVCVSWNDGPSEKEVDKIVDAFSSRRADSTGDYWDDVTLPVHVVCGSFSYSHCERTITPEVREYVKSWFDNHLYRDAATDNWRREQDISRLMNKLLADTSFPIGGYEIAGIRHDDTDYEFYMEFKQKSEPTPPPEGGKKASPTTGAEISVNKAKHGIELRFAEIPTESVRNMMKANGWRWSKFNKCWYCKDSLESRKLAAQVLETINGKETAAA